MSSIRVKIKNGDPMEEKEKEIRYAEAEQNRADIAYLAMMTNIELGEEEGEE